MSGVLPKRVRWFVEKHNNSLNHGRINLGRNLRTRPRFKEVTITDRNFANNASYSERQTYYMELPTRPKAISNCGESVVDCFSLLGKKLAEVAEDRLNLNITPTSLSLLWRITLVCVTKRSLLFANLSNYPNCFDNNRTAVSVRSAVSLFIRRRIG